jgi:hypothetical protein
MWIYTKKGFFSAVRNREDGSLIHVRSQFRGDLERLLAACGAKASVTSTPDGDYRFRTDIPSAIWRRFLADEAKTIDYETFKPAVHGNPLRDYAYLEVFFALMRGGRAEALRETVNQDRQTI